MALVVILALLVLITAVVMAFFVHATSNRIVETSRSNQTAVSLLGKTAGDYAAGKFLEEISLPANNTEDSTNGVYFPKTAANAVPQRMVAASVPDSDEFLTLVRQSISTADTNASGDGTTVAAKNGRNIDINRWNLPQLLSGSGFTENSQTPAWIYVTESGPTNTISTNVVGRFAYNVYEVGGLLNANAAGYPSGEIPALFKGFPAGANLDRLGVSGTAVNELIAFRNQSSGNYSNIVSASARSGFLTLMTTNAVGTIVSTNNYFSGRQDLLRYVQTQNIGLTNALPYLTHFSRSVNAPSWNATVSTSSNTGLPTAQVPAGMTNVTHYLDNGAQTSRDVTPGAPLLQSRFSLARLAWLGHNGPESGISADAVQACFGLKWNGSDNRWTYVGSTGSAAQSVIKTLDQVAAEGREPNFFELLKAAILSGSLGLGPGNGTAGTVNAYYSGQKDAQIIQIGANIIDQYDADFFPTAIYFPAVATVPGPSMPSNIFNTYFGIENIPYLSRLYAIGMNIGKMAAWIQPQLWNPHQAPPVGSGSSAPTSFRVKTYGTNNMRWKQTSYNETTSTTLNYNTTHQTKGILYFGTTITDFRNNPQVLRKGLLTSSDLSNTDVKNVWQTTYPWGANPFVAIFCGETNAVPKQFPDNNKNNPINVYALDQYSGTPEITVTLEYWDGGQWLPYNAMACLKKIDANAYQDIRGWDVGISFVGRVDPRTDRFSGSVKYTNNPPDAQNTTFQPDASTRYPVYKLQPNAAAFVPAPTTGADTFFGEWVKNLASGSARYSDPDGVLRPGDAFRASGNEGNPLFHGTPNSPRRPIVLNRPFQSIGELGYAYRDLPFKSLDFSSDKSADSALLDVFSLEDEPYVTAGGINVNKAPTPVLSAVLAGGREDVYSSSVLSDNDALSVATAIASSVKGTPLKNRSDLVNQLGNPSNGALGSAAGRATKNLSEAPLRALSSVVNTRTWNFMIDVIAQSGRLPAQASATGASFLVEGERRYWLHIAIDRYTGKIVDQQLELVSE